MCLFGLSNGCPIVRMGSLFTDTKHMGAKSSTIQDDQTCDFGHSGTACQADAAILDADQVVSRSHGRVREFVPFLYLCAHDSHLWGTTNVDIKGSLSSIRRHYSELGLPTCHQWLVFDYCLLQGKWSRPHSHLLKSLELDTSTSSITIYFKRIGICKDLG